MILVDTSVWIDFFAGKDLPHVEKLEALLINEADISICGIVLTEILQGISDDKQFKKTRDYLQPLIFLEINTDIWLGAAQLYRELRKKGVTIRRTNDCIIAVTALDYDCCLLHNDRDFRRIAENTKLKTNCA